MPALPVTALYAALLAVVGIVLMLRVGLMRFRTGVSILHGDDPLFAQTIRRHANFIENVPLALVLMVLAEANGAGQTFLHVIGIVLVVSRIAHPLGLLHDRPIHPLRLLGTAGTLVTMIALGGAAVSLW